MTFADITKRSLDLVISFLGLVLLSPLLLLAALAIWLEDSACPLYIAPRVGKNGREFNMIKLRSMVVDADKKGGCSTASTDPRLTKTGLFIRRLKLDELPQLWNVFIGQMSLVGPRPNVKSEVANYTEDERKLLLIKPGVTDIASIVFSNEGEILKNCIDPDASYNVLIRPWKSRLALTYVEKRSTLLDLTLIAVTAASVISRASALGLLSHILRIINASPDSQRFIQQLSRSSGVKQ